MLNGKERNRVTRKSLSLKKPKNKERNHEGQADISKYFQKSSCSKSIKETENRNSTGKSTASPQDDDSIQKFKTSCDDGNYRVTRDDMNVDVNKPADENNPLESNAISSTKKNRTFTEEETRKEGLGSLNKVHSSFSRHEEPLGEADEQMIPPTPSPDSTFHGIAFSKNGSERGKHFVKRRTSGDPEKNAKKKADTNERSQLRNKLTLKRKFKTASLNSSNKGNVSCLESSTMSNTEQDLDKKIISVATTVINSSTEKSRENAAKDVVPRPSLQGARKTYKLSRKIQKAVPEAACKSTQLYKKSINTSGRENIPRKEERGEDVMSSYGISSLSLSNGTVDFLEGSVSLFDDDIMEGQESATLHKPLNGRSLKRFAEKGISPLKKRPFAETCSGAIKPKRNLLNDLGPDENSNLDDKIAGGAESTGMSQDMELLEISDLQSSDHSSSKPNPEEKQSRDPSDDFLDISMSSLTNDEMFELMDGIVSSPVSERSAAKKERVVSPAKQYVRSKSTELSNLTSNLAMKNTKQLPTETVHTAGSDKEDYRRFLVLEVYRREVLDDMTCRAGASEKVLRLFDESSSSEKYCQLREDWERTEVEHGDIVNIIGKPSSTTSYILDNQTESYIIVHPDILVTPTAISSSTRCLRRSVLEKYFKTEGPNEVMFLGTLMHSIFDSAIISEDLSTNTILGKTKELLQKVPNLTEIYGLGITEDDILSKLSEHAAALSEWGEKYFRKEPHAVHGVIDFKDGAAQKSNSSDNVAVCVSKVIDIEECVWSPKFGLKGKVDATVEVKINKNANIMKRAAACYETSVLPLELKTGKLYSKLGSVEHRAQVILYSLLMLDRYPNTMNTGLLLYLKTGHMLGVPAYLHEKRALVMKRNEMVRYMSNSGTRLLQNMPGMLQDERTCNYCSQLKVCTLYHKSMEKGSSESAGIGKLFDKMTNHLSAIHLEYFLHWNKLISLESQAMKDSGREPDLWCLSGLQREQLGYCFSEMLLVSCEVSESGTGADSFVNKFVKQEAVFGKIAVSEMHLAKGDYVVVSQKNGMIALATGFLVEVSEDFVSVLLDKNLNSCYHHTSSSEDQVLYRIDKAEISTGLVIQWSNLAKLFFADSEQDAKLRRLIVDLEAPSFTRQKNVLSNISSSQASEVWTSQSSSCSITSPVKSSQCGDELTSILNDLNSDQRKAINKVLTAQDYALILGMPGTGKTTTIACLVRALVTLGKSVLLTSYTHSAVDNILLKLKQSNVDFLRLGSVHKIHPDIQLYGVENAAKHVKSVSELKLIFESKVVVATTCLGVNHALFNQRSFDYCIVDEASQITQPVCFGSLRRASIFVLVGDHYQLPPLVQSHEAREGGMDISLFRRLSENHPQSVVNLEHQYRMHKDIMLLSNTLIYEHRLKCGTQEIAECLLDLPRLATLYEKQHQDSCSWLLEVLDPHRPIIFVDTDDLPAPETRSGHNVYNENEAALVATITHGLVKSGLKPSFIGVISPYRHQLKIIKKHLNVESGKFQDLLTDVEINTVDKYQGRDKHCIIVSWVRSNDRGHVGDLLRDWRRVNVALTRAKQKLIFLGSRKTLKNNVLFQELFTLLHEHSWIYNLPKDSSWKTIV